MTRYILLYSVFLLPFSVAGQPTADAVKPTVPAAEYCAGVENFSECKIKTFECNANSKCSCKDEQPYCRCHNYKDTWFLGRNCEQEWNVVTFALVAALPGLALAAVVGVTVQCVHQLRKSAKPAKKPDGHTKPGTPAGDPNGAYSNLVFASDLPSRPPRMHPTQERFPMSNALSQPYSPQTNNMRPTAALASPESQPYSYVTGMSPPVGNPDARSALARSPYEDRAPPPGRYENYRPSQPPAAHSGMVGGGVSGFPAAGSSPAPFYSAPEFSPRSAFPRAQTGRHM